MTATFRTTVLRSGCAPWLLLLAAACEDDSLVIPQSSDAVSEVPAADASSRDAGVVGVDGAAASDTLKVSIRTLQGAAQASVSLACGVACIDVEASAADADSPSFQWSDGVRGPRRSLCNEGQLEVTATSSDAATPREFGRTLSGSATVNVTREACSDAAVPDSNVIPDGCWPAGLDGFCPSLLGSRTRVDLGTNKLVKGQPYAIYMGTTLSVPGKVLIQESSSSCGAAQTLTVYERSAEQPERLPLPFCITPSSDSSHISFSFDVGLAGGTRGLEGGYICKGCPAPDS